MLTTYEYLGINEFATTLILIFGVLFLSNFIQETDLGIIKIPKRDRRKSFILFTTLIFIICCLGYAKVWESYGFEIKPLHYSSKSSLNVYPLNTRTSKRNDNLDVEIDGYFISRHGIIDTSSNKKTWIVSLDDFPLNLRKDTAEYYVRFGFNNESLLSRKYKIVVSSKPPKVYGSFRRRSDTTGYLKIRSRPLSNSKLDTIEIDFKLPKSIDVKQKSSNYNPIDNTYQSTFNIAINKAMIAKEDALEFTVKDASGNSYHFSKNVNQLVNTSKLTFGNLNVSITEAADDLIDLKINGIISKDIRGNPIFKFEIEKKADGLLISWISPSVADSLFKANSRISMNVTDNPEDFQILEGDRINIDYVENHLENQNIKYLKDFSLLKTTTENKWYYGTTRYRNQIGSRFNQSKESIVRDFTVNSHVFSPCYWFDKEYIRSSSPQRTGEFYDLNKDGEKDYISASISNGICKTIRLVIPQKSYVDVYLIPINRRVYSDTYKPLLQRERVEYDELQFFIDNVVVPNFKEEKLVTNKEFDKAYQNMEHIN